MKKINWTPNGFIVQDINDKSNSQKKQPYKGLGCCYAWPLSKMIDEKSKSLTDEADERWFGYFYKDKYALAVVPSLEYLRRYLRVCAENGIEVRVLFVESERETPMSDKIEIKATFLGYDYVTSQDFFSVLYDDLFAEEIPKNLERFKALLNHFGLFSKEEDLYAYVKERNNALEAGYNLEAHGDFCMMKISLVHCNNCIL
jgi:hypothetical protein